MIQWEAHRGESIPNGTRDRWAADIRNRIVNQPELYYTVSGDRLILGSISVSNGKLTGIRIIDAVITRSSDLFASRGDFPSGIPVEFADVALAEVRRQHSNQAETIRLLLAQRDQERDDLAALRERLDRQEKVTVVYNNNFVSALNQVTALDDELVKQNAEKNYILAAVKNQEDIIASLRAENALLREVIEEQVEVNATLYNGLDDAQEEIARLEEELDEALDEALDEDYQEVNLDEDVFGLEPEGEPCTCRNDYSGQCPADTDYPACEPGTQDCCQESEVTEEDLQAVTRQMLAEVFREFLGTHRDLPESFVVVYPGPSGT